MRNLLALDIWRQTGVVTCPTHRHIDHTTSDIGSNRPHLRMATRPVWSLGRGSAVPCARTWWFDRATQVLPVCVWSRDCRRPADLRLHPTCVKREDLFPATWDGADLRFSNPQLDTSLFTGRNGYGSSAQSHGMSAYAPAFARLCCLVTQTNGCKHNKVRHAPRKWKNKQTHQIKVKTNKAMHGRLIMYKYQLSLIDPSQLYRAVDRVWRLPVIN